MSNNNKWTFNLEDSNLWDEELYEAREDAIKAALDEVDFEEKIYIGKTENIIPQLDVDIDLIIDHMANQTECNSGLGGDFDIVGNVYRLFTKKLSYELEELLNKTIKDFIADKGLTIDTYKIIDIEEIPISYNDDGEPKIIEVIK